MPAQKDKDTPVVTRVLRLRLKDKHAAVLREKAFWVNQVWNYCNDLSCKVWERERRFLSGYDFAEYTRGATKEGLPLHSQSVQAIAEEYATRRKQFKKVKLRWRVSSGPRRHLGWVPFKKSALRYRNGQLFLSGFDQPLSLWDSYGLSKYELGAGNLSEDARGRWYLNVTVKVKKSERSEGESAVGIDLGLKDFAATSDGVKLEAQQFYRRYEEALGKAQRANKKHRVRALHAKIKHCRKDFLHKASTQLVRSHGLLFIGNVNASQLAKTKMAKSVLDAGWSAFRDMLQYKSDTAGVWFEEVDERYSTQTCSCCNARTGPTGLDGLNVRAWTCSVCQAKHDRDVNAAKNILRWGLARMEKAFSVAADAATNKALSTDSTRVGRDPLVEGISVL